MHVGMISKYVTIFKDLSCWAFFSCHFSALRPASFPALYSSFLPPPSAFPLSSTAPPLSSSCPSVPVSCCSPANTCLLLTDLFYRCLKTQTHRQTQTERKDITENNLSLAANWILSLPVLIFFPPNLRWLLLLCALYVFHLSYTVHIFAVSCSVKPLSDPNGMLLWFICLPTSSTELFLLNITTYTLLQPSWITWRITFRPFFRIETWLGSSPLLNPVGLLISLITAVSFLWLFEYRFPQQNVGVYSCC